MEGLPIISVFVRANCTSLFSLTWSSCLLLNLAYIWAESGILKKKRKFPWPSHLFRHDWIHWLYQSGQVYLPLKVWSKKKKKTLDGFDALNISWTCLYTVLLRFWSDHFPFIAVPPTKMCFCPLTSMTFDVLASTYELWIGLEELQLNIRADDVLLFGSFV